MIGYWENYSFHASVRQKRSDPIFEVLKQRQIPCLLTTGHSSDRTAMPGEIILQKPYRGLDWERER